MAMAQPDHRFVPGDWAGQTDWFKNWALGMTEIGASLGFSAAELTRIGDDYIMMQFLRDTMVTVEAFDDSITQHRRIMSRGKVGDPTPALSAGPTITPPVTTDPVPPGIWQRNNEDVRRVREAPAYTEETGAFLGILPIVGDGLAEGDVQPALKVTVSPGYHVKIAGKMMGMDALRIDYQPNGSTAWQLAAFLTKLPGEFVISPQADGQPEQGRVRGVYIRSNAEYGQFSPEYPVTVG